MDTGVPRTIAEIVAVNPGAALVYPNGPPQAVAPPGWSTDDETEMDLCQREFFLKNCHQVPDILLEDVLYSFDCIGFMDGDEAAPWLPIWMCASYYAADVLYDPGHNVTLKAGFALEKCLRAGKVPLTLAAIECFTKRFFPGPEEDPELYDAIKLYRAPS